jgi:hypothetical protein
MNVWFCRRPFMPALSALELPIPGNNFQPAETKKRLQSAGLVLIIWNNSSELSTKAIADGERIVFKETYKLTTTLISLSF